MNPLGMLLYSKNCAMSFEIIGTDFSIEDVSGGAFSNTALRDHPKTCHFAEFSSTTLDEPTPCQRSQCYFRCNLRRRFDPTLVFPMGLTLRACSQKVWGQMQNRELQTVEPSLRRGKIPNPRIDEYFDSLGEEKMFSTLDLACGCFQKSIYPYTVSPTTFCTSSGLYEWLRIPQGAASAPGRFQRLVLRVIEGLKHAIMYYYDAVAFDVSPRRQVCT